MCLYLYIHNKYTQHTHIMQTKTLILDAINHEKMRSFDSTKKNIFEIKLK